MAKKEKPAKTAKAAKPKKGAKAADAAVAAASIAGHPRARVAIRRVRARVACGVFLLVALVGLRAGLTPFDATWRALIAGIVANIVSWRCALVVWRHIVVAELHAAEAQYAERRRKAIEAAEARVAEQRAAVAANRPVGFRAA
jgi:hypothetical protein